MRTISRAVIAIGLFACVVLSAVQAMATKPQRPACEISNGTCVTVSCDGECAPVFPDPCACIR
jgi:predicted cobalt transporter CbtA